MYQPNFHYRNNKVIFLCANKQFPTYPDQHKGRTEHGSSDLYPLLWKMLFLSCISCPSTIITVGSFYMLLAEKKRQDLKRINVKSSLHENRGVF